MCVPLNPAPATKPCAADIAGNKATGRGDGKVNVEDLIPLLGAFGKTGAAAAPYDIAKTGASNGRVDVEDLLLLLKTFGSKTCSVPSAPTLPPSTGAIPSDCTTWYDGCNRCSVSNGAVGACTKMMCKTSTTKFCMAYSSGKTCSSPTACTGGSNPAPPPAPTCTQGTACGGQIQVSCGTACPNICGKPTPGMCPMMCFQGYQCPRGQWWDAQTGKCVPTASDCSGGNSGGGPPGVVIGRPFISTQGNLMASAVESASDWL